LPGVSSTDDESTTRDEFGQKIYGSGDNSGRKEVARSGVSTFVCGTMKNPTHNSSPQQQTNYFIDLEQWSENQTYFINSGLPVSLHNPYARRTLSFVIYNDKHEVMELNSVGISLDPGLNNVTIDLSSAELTPGKYYFAELSLEDGYYRTIKLFKTER